MKRPPNGCKLWADIRARDAGILTSLVGRVFHTIFAFRRRVNFKAKRAYLHRSKYGLYPSREVDQIMLKFRTISLILDFRLLVKLQVFYLPVENRVRRASPSVLFERHHAELDD